MKITPMVSYKKPAYPTIEESKQDVHLLENLPKRWEKGGAIASLIGTGIFIHIVGAGCRSGDVRDDGTKAKLVAFSDAERNTAPKTTRTRAIPATRVAPMLEEALANDGRGGFGCQAISAPVFLSENEAMDLIEAELQKVGLNVKDMVTVDGLNIPDANVESRYENNYGDEQDWDKFKMKKLTKGSYTFDLGTEDKSVVVKFLRKKDYNQWKDDRGMWSFVSSYDLPTLATQMSDAFTKRTKGDPIVIGLFFEPMTYPLLEDNEWKPAETRQDTEARNREKLRAQVLHFVEYLKKEGVVE